MKNTLIILMIVSTMIVTSCSNKQDNGSNERQQMYMEFLMDRDAMIEAVNKIDDYVGIEYSDDQVSEWAKLEQFGDYKYVVKKFVKENLKSDIETFQTISLTNNTRLIVVTTKDYRIIKLSLEKRDENKGVWLVDAYGEL